MLAKLAEAMASLQAVTYVICGAAVELASMTIQLDGYRVIAGVCGRRSHCLAGELRLISRSHRVLLPIFRQQPCRCFEQ